MLKILITTFILPSLVTYILIRLLRIKLLWDEHHISKCPDDDVFIMTLIYPLGFSYIFVHCLVKLHSIIRSRIEYLAGVIINELIDIAGSGYFCESFYGHPYPTSGKNYATANAFGGPSRPASLVAYPTRGMQHSYRNDSTRFRKACIFTTLCSVKTHALSLLGTTRLLSRSDWIIKTTCQIQCSHSVDKKWHLKPIPHITSRQSV